MNTPVYPGSREAFVSGQAVQCDIIPAAGPPYYGANIEDGLALLDERGRDRLRDEFPMSGPVSRRGALSWATCSVSG